MWSLRTIDQMSRAATDKAKRKGLKQPKLITAAQIEEMPPFPFPNFGHYEPLGWTECERWQVDSTGVDKCGLAFSVEGFKRHLLEYIERHPTHGFAIVEVGQFQVYVGAFMPIEEARTRGD